MALVPFTFERGDTIYLVSPIAPFEPDEAEIEEFAFAEGVSLLKHAPNPNIVWLRGQYVEADRPNLNGAMWLSDELAIKSLTPNLMPVTVMHDPRTAVGLIADTVLKMPDEAAGIKRPRLDNTIGLWGHRFPEAVEEALANYEAGQLMQSMECRAPYYDCAECGKRFPKLPNGAEESNWCAHLKGVQGEQAARILGAVCFTGTGLIFGSRGAKGAYTDASLEPLMDEVAEFHERAHHHEPRTPSKPKPRSKNTMEIEDTRYQELVAAEAKLKELEPKLASAEETAAKVPDLEKSVEELETAKVAAETERDTLKTEKETLEEAARADELKSERWGKLGKDFLAKLGEKTKAKLEEQAKDLKDEDWASRLDELAELTGVAADAGGKPDPAAEAEGTFSQEEIARAGNLGGGGNGGGGNAPSAEKRRSVAAGLAKITTGASS